MLALVAVVGCTTHASLQEIHQSGVSGSGQGGYLGLGAGSHQASAESMAPHESHQGDQGGYLGRTAGADLKPLVMPTGDMRESPTKWCPKSTDLYRCRTRAAVEHQI